MKKYTRGFTLIELLVVIAIIGILASVVLVSLQSARKKGNDTRVISDVNQIRTQLESDYNNGVYTDLYIAAAGTTATPIKTTAVSPNLSTLETDATNNSGSITYVATSNSNAGTVAAPNVTKYSIWGKLPSQTTATYFCIDSTGNAKPNTTAAPAGNDVCI